jgi:serine/threonine protein kinase
MEPTTFLEHYRICPGEAGRQASRTGAAINYKAIDIRTHAPVQLQLIPLSTIAPEKLPPFKERAETAEKLDHVNIAKTFAVGVDHDYFVVVSEYFEGETADKWVMENGPMAADAALRVGLQIVRALGAAAFFNLSHRAIQPSNLMILPGKAPDDGWPFVKLLNFGLASLELHSDSNEAPEIAPSISPQFASPEQRAGLEINFESEMYSLGATLCFLLTGAAPLAVSGMKARLRIRRLPELRRAPKPLHNLLVWLLRENADNRPHDPVAVENQMRDCLTRIERRQAIGRKLGLSLATVVPRKPKESQRQMNPLAQILGGVVAVILLLLGVVAAAEYFFPDKIPSFRRNDNVGVEIGVPDAMKFAALPGQKSKHVPDAISQPGPSASPPVTASKENAAVVTDRRQTEPRAEDTNSVMTPTTIWNQIAGATRASSAEPNPRSPGSAAAASGENSDSTESEESTAPDRNKPIATGRRSTSQPERAVRETVDNENPSRPTSYSMQHRARVVGTTADGRLVVRLSTGRTVILPRLRNGDIYAPQPRRRILVDRPTDDFTPPSQPFNP